jgi:hypothetical protein
LNLGVAAWAGCVDGRKDFGDVPFDDAPAALTQDDKSDLAPGKVLLIAEVAVL